MYWLQVVYVEASRPYLEEEKKNKAMEYKYCTIMKQLLSKAFRVAINQIRNVIIQNLIEYCSFLLIKIVIR